VTKYIRQKPCSKLLLKCQILDKKTIIINEYFLFIKNKFIAV